MIRCLKIKSSGLKIFISDTRISKPLKLPQNIMVPTIYFHVCGAVGITSGSLLDMCLNDVSSIAAL